MLDNLERPAGGLEPENGLEEALLKVARDPAHLPDLYRALAEANLFVPQGGAEPQLEEAVGVRAGATVALPVFRDADRRYVPVFTSMAQLLLFVPVGARYALLNGRELAAMWDGDDWLAINPKGGPGRNLAPDEVRALVAASK